MGPDLVVGRMVATRAGYEVRIKFIICSKWVKLESVRCSNSEAHKVKPVEAMFSYLHGPMPVSHSYRRRWPLEDGCFFLPRAELTIC